MKTGHLPRTLSLSAESELKLQAAGDENAAPTVRITAYTGGEMRFPQFQFPVVVDLAGMQVTEKPRPILLDHDVKQPVGHTIGIENNGRTLEITAVLSGEGEHAQRVLKMAQRDFPWQASIGVSLPKPVTFLAAGKQALVNGRQVTGPLYIAKESFLRETSITALGRDDNTSSRVAASLGVQQMNKKFVKWLEAAGFNPDDLGDDQIKSLEATWKSEQETAAKLKETESKLSELQSSQATKTEPEGQVDGELEAHAADIDKVVAERLQRHADIRDICASFGNPKVEVDGAKVDLAAHAIAKGWTKEQTELKALRTSMSDSAPAAHINQPRTPQNNLQAFEAGMVARLTGFDDEFLKANYDPKVLEAAESRELRSAYSRPLSYLIHEAIRSTGNYVNPTTSGDALEASYKQFVLQAAGGPSTVSIPGILSNIANKSALAAFLAVPTTWREIADVRSVSDFKKYTSYRLTSAGQFLKVGKDGEIKATELSEYSRDISVETWGRRYFFSRQDLINDDLGMLSGIRAHLGRQAALTLEEEVYKLWMDTSDNFWHASNGNLKTGTPLSVAGLAAVEQLFLDQKDDDGKPIVNGASRLLVPTSLKYTADRIYQSPNFNELTPEGVPAPATNVYAGRFPSIVSPYLNNPAMANNSATSWWMLGTDMRAIQVAFLNGVQTPVVDSQEAPFHVLGFELRGYFDFGVARLEERSAIKVTA